MDLVSDEMSALSATAEISSTFTKCLEKKKKALPTA